MSRLKCSILLIVCLAQTSFGANKVTPQPVTVLKCCRIGERLRSDSASSTIQDDNIYCEPGASPMWVPLIYAPRRHNYLPSGSTPPHWKVTESRPECPANTNATLIKSTQPNFTLFVNGSLWLHDLRTMLAPQSFCVDSSLAAIACLKKEEPTNSTPEMQSMLSIKKIKVKKCCGEAGAYSEKAGSCIAGWIGEPFTPDTIKLIRDSDNDTSIVQFVNGFPACAAETSGMVIAGTLKEAALDSEGYLQVSNAAVRLGNDNFCLEIVTEQGEACVFACSESVPSQVPSDHIDGSDLRLTLYPLGLLTSTIFLLATLGAAILLRSTHHALHWRCQMHYIACLLVGDLMLAITQLAGKNIDGTACIFIAVTIHFFFLAAFFWLNTMCFNIWWTFRDFRPTSLEKRQEVCRLRFYEVYAWGGPLLIAGIGLLLDRLPQDPDQSFLRPRFGVRRCWFYGDLEILTFFFGPIGILLGINLLLFASTARQLTCGLWKREDVKSTTERAALGRVCLKLVIVMGVTWIADVVSWAVGGPSYLWYMTDLINALQGVLIFIVVGCQPQVWAAVKKMWCMRLLKSNATNAIGAPMHSSSQGLPSMGDSVTNNTIANTTNTSNVKIPMETVC